MTEMLNVKAGPRIRGAKNAFALAGVNRMRFVRSLRSVFLSLVKERRAEAKSTACARRSVARFVKPE
jgi:hypothetical protein